MKREGKYAVQISTIHKLQHVLDVGLKVLTFTWRHAFVLAVFGMMIYGICHGKTPVIGGASFAFGIAAFIDWFKMQINFSSGSNNAREQMFESARRNRDSSRFGSSAWATNPAMVGSPANHLYNLGYLRTSYN